MKGAMGCTTAWILMTMMSWILLSGSVSSVTTVEENIEKYSVTLTRIVQRCYDCSYTTCSNFADYRGYLCYRRCCYARVYSYWLQYHKKCETKTVRNCCNYVQTYMVERKRCKTGWVNYPYCNVAVCNPACATGKTCVAPNNCQCLTQGGGICKTVPCSDTVNCYPGTCTNKDTSTCSCPPGFEGPNCITLSYTPQILKCSATLYANPGGTEIAVGVVNECAAIEIEPQTVWVGKNALNAAKNLALTKIDVSWEASYVNPMRMPDRQSAPFIENSPISIGVTKSQYTIQVVGSAAAVAPVNCPHAFFSTQNIPPIALCRNIAKPWNALGISGTINNNATMIISVTAELGGEKRGIGYSATIPGGNFPEQRFNSTSTMRSMSLSFDFESPTHCAAGGSEAICDVFPIYLNETITRNSRIRPNFTSWTDTGSGIKDFKGEVFLLTQNAGGLLEEIGQPVCSSNNIIPDTSNFVCDLKEPGVYSVVATAYDGAGNTAKARKILTYIDRESMEQTDVPMRIVGAEPQSDYKFITNLQTPSDGVYEFTASWPGSFRSTLNEDWLKAVEPWNSGQYSSELAAGIDDIYHLKYGLRSTDPLPKHIGILAYEFEFITNSAGGMGAKRTGNASYTTTDTGTSEYTFNVTKAALEAEGSTIVMWLTAYDLDANTKTMEQRVSVHRSRVDIKIQNVTFLPKFQYEYNSSVQMNIISRVGGIKNITFDIFDRTRQAEIRKGDVARIRYRDWPYDNPSSREKRQAPGVPNECPSSGDPSCYCIPAGVCYDVSQYLVIDNCWIDRYAGNEIEIRYTMNTLSGYQLNNRDNPFIVAINKDTVKCRPGEGFNNGFIALIIIGSLLLLLLLVLLLLMCLRWRQNKHPVPMRVRTMINDMRHRSFHNRTNENELYGVGPQNKGKQDNIRNDLKVAKVTASSPASNLYAGKNSDPHDYESKSYAGNKSDPHDYESLVVYTSKNINIGTQTLGEGRFASVKKGTLTEGNQNITIAIKALKNGYPKSDAEIMQRKIRELSNLPHHPNLVNLKGIYKDDVTGRAPAMVLDYCETPLKDWLESLKTVDPETLDTMHNYAKDIARGMEHLHDNNIIHRKLTAKNVLLSPTAHGTIAKVTGFGPSKDDTADGQKGQNPSLVKVKWLAPETIETLKSDNPEYNEKTDVWSYGVTLWEMYSKGDSPYADIKSADLLKQLQKGHRLTCPEYCAPDLYGSVIQPCWNVNSDKRPSFDDICRFLDQFSSGTNTQSYYGVNELGGAYGGKVPPGYYAPDKLKAGYEDNDRKRNEYRESNVYSDAR